MVVQLNTGDGSLCSSGETILLSCEDGWGGQELCVSWFSTHLRGRKGQHTEPSPVFDDSGASDDENQYDADNDPLICVQGENVHLAFMLNKRRESSFRKPYTKYIFLRIELVI